MSKYFSSIALILQKLCSDPGDRIVEFGVGWAHTARFFADFGLNVTVVDIEKRFLELIDEFVHKGSTPITKIHSSFTETNIADNSFDAAVFFESFHHCFDHQILIKQLRKMLRLGGKIVFCGEPFYDDW